MDGAPLRVLTYVTEWDAPNAQSMVEDDTEVDSVDELDGHPVDAQILGQSHIVIEGLGLITILVGGGPRRAKTRLFAAFLIFGLLNNGEHPVLFPSPSPASTAGHIRVLIVASPVCCHLVCCHRPRPRFDTQRRRCLLQCVPRSDCKDRVAIHLPRSDTLWAKSRFLHCVQLGWMYCTPFLPQVSLGCRLT